MSVLHDVQFNFVIGDFKYIGFLKFFMKQVIIVRNDLKLSPGKLAVQASHASVSAALLAQKKKKTWFNTWLSEGQKKVVVLAKNEKHLSELLAKAKKLGIPAELIRDAGFTELLPGTVTCLGIGPAPEEIVDKVSGSLPLL
jgi:PTH2 family peptidyl-tRNA hydrolase